ncbi:MAG: DUF2520 domain-containing protein [Bacteroidetes bacterium]|nr:DUF2520 domain-containing protein [Bacteroidota bacterium]
MFSSIKTISLIGAGNVATHLAVNFFRKKYRIGEIISRSPHSARKLARRVKANPIWDPALISKDTDLVIISVSDSALPGITAELNLGKIPVVHTSGSVPVNVLKKCSSNYGVLYPFQSLRKEKIVDFRNIPLCIEANNNFMRKILLRLCRSLSGNVIYLDSGKRKILHLAGVFSGNFSNFMYCIAAKILKDSGLPFSLAVPLINEVAARANRNSPSEMQTGPAIRNDKKIISLHLEMLRKYPQYRKIYLDVTNGIMKEFSR